METERRKEVISLCLDLFIEKGLTETSTRNLSRALKLQNAGLYYYFENKDAAVIACAEEAALRLEKHLIAPALHDINNPSMMLQKLRKRADEMAPTMRFLVSVCVSETYREKMKPALERLSGRYEQYSTQFAKVLGCQVEHVRPYVHMGVTAVTNYMIFGEDDIVYPQIQIIENQINKLLST